MLLILIFLINTVTSIRIGLISDATYIATNYSQIIPNITCNQCTCRALMTSAIGWNCMKTNNICQLITNYSTNDIGLIKSINSTFIFQQLPPQPSLITVNPMTTQLQTTTTAPTTAQLQTSTVAFVTTQLQTTAPVPVTTQLQTTTVAPVTTQLQTTTIIYPITSIATTTFAASSTNIISTVPPTTTMQTLQPSNITANRTGTVTIKFTFQTTFNYIWYLDDVSVRDSSLIEKTTNGNFESLPSLTGWTTGYSGFCSFGSGISSLAYYSASKSYSDSCSLGSTWIYQSFTVTNGQSYNVSFWFYLNGLILLFDVGTATMSVVIS
ncbi:unnamed protein product [Adineta steineri]|uniref:Uncharacterized protein n=1 Tax=Adineta steineri TaxID=433720 RepID=A0A819S6K3_9BILA|nr:unnamed protein product [Adineta steineri]CAF4047937.1 unnamed protein product [Adineta steineri]